MPAAKSREAIAELANEQAALSRVATLVAQGAAPAEIFAAVSAEVDRVFGLDPATLDIAVVGRFEPGPELEIVGISKSVDIGPLGSRWPPDDLFAPTHVLRTGRSARIRVDDVVSAGGEVAEMLRTHNYLSQVASPIVVDGRLWGAMLVTTRNDLPPDTEDRLAQFTELVATAIANAESREALSELANEQAALRRVATLVAGGAPPGEIFSAVAEEVGGLLGPDHAVMARFDAPDVVTIMAEWTSTGDPPRLEKGRPLQEGGIAKLVQDSGRPARVDNYVNAARGRQSWVLDAGTRAAVAAPITVDGRLWGVMGVGSRGAPPPAGTEERLANFTELVATAIANTQAREELRTIAAEQAALRRVATLVAQGASPQDLFDAVAEEIGRLFLAANVSMGRYEPDDMITSMASWSAAGPVFTPGVRWPIKGTNVAWNVLKTGRPARIDDFSVATDPIGIAVRDAGYKSAIGSPIVVEGQLWGVISAASTEGLMPPDGELRLERFTDLVATAIANAEARHALAASRRRIVAASDDARRRIERDLHDGVQQQLVTLALELGAMKAEPPTGEVLTEQLATATEDVRSVLDALVELARGIHPAILSQGGLDAALAVLARRSAVRVELQSKIDAPLPDEVAVAAYYVAAEALTNAAKHARASVVHLDAATQDGTLTMMVQDDGIGGADAGRGSGLVGLQDRVEALGGTIEFASATGLGTSIAVTLPLTEVREK